MTLACYTMRQILTRRVSVTRNDTERRGPLPMTPGWLPLAARRATMTPAWQSWIGSRDSLTMRLTAAGKGRTFRVHLLRQGLGKPTIDEAHALHLPFDRFAWLREVTLCLDDVPWVAARSVAPLTHLRGQRLEGLGERSLGSWLFRQHDLERGPIEVTTAPAPFHPLTGPWGRSEERRVGTRSRNSA